MQHLLPILKFSDRKMRKAISSFGIATGIFLLTSCANEGSAQTENIKPEVKAGKITWNVQQNATFYKSGSSDDCYILLSLTGGNADDQKTRTPLNISVVLDRSGSMDGDKLKYAQKATNFLIDQLTPQDKLSIVDYDDVVEILSKQNELKNKELLKTKVNALTPRDGTNLTGGTLEGYSQVNAMKKSGYVNRVLLLTDGLANQGITEPSEIKKLVTKKFTTLGIGLSTFGVGADYNEDLLTMMSETGRGNYYFIGEADQIPNIFAKELKGLLSVVAQNAYVQFSLPKNVTCEKVYGYPFVVNSDKTITVNFNDVYANEEKVILIKLHRNNSEKEPFTVSGTMNYTSTNDFTLSSTDFSVKYAPTDSKEKIAGTSNKKVEEMISLYQSTEEFDRIIEDAEHSDYSAARSKADVALKDIKQKQATMPSAKLKAQEVKIDNYLKSLSDIEVRTEQEKKIIQKSGKATNYETKKNK